MADVEVRVGPDGTLEHRHAGYNGGWHPVSQKHKDPKLHQSLGITGKEKPNRRSPSSIGMKDPGSETPKRKPKQVGRNSKPQWRWDDDMTVTDYLKLYATARPTSATGKTLVSAVNAMSAFLTFLQRRMDERDAKATSQGFEDAFKAFDERFKFHGTDDFDRLSASDIRRIDGELERMARAKFAEYGGEALKGKRDPESLRRKAEIRTYIELQQKLREQARRQTSRRRYQTSATGSDGAGRPMSARDIRERNKRQRQSE